MKGLITKVELVDMVVIVTIEMRHQPNEVAKVIRVGQVVEVADA